MKKVMVVVGTGVLLIFMAMTSYAVMTKKPITSADLSSLKGKWTGQRLIKGADVKYPAFLEIKNDTLPLEGKLTLHNVMKKGVKGRTEIVGLEKTELTKDGNLLIKTPSFQVPLSLSVEGSKMKLEGKYKFEEIDGTLYLEK